MLTFPVMAKTRGKLEGTDAIIAANIDRFISESGLSRKAIAEKMHLPIENISMISQYRHGHKAAGKGWITRLAKALGRSPSDFYQEAAPTPLSIAETAARYGVPEPLPFSVRIVYSKKFEEPQLPQVRESDYLPVPIVEARVAAGIPEIVTNEQVVDIAFIHRRTLKKKNPRDLICTFVKGDSMEPILRDGAIVCIDTKARPEGKKVPAGSMWAVRKDDGVVVKYLQIRDSTLVLVSENKAYPVELVKDTEAIVGKVVWVWQSFS